MGLFKVYIEAAKIGRDYTLLFNIPMFTVYFNFTEDDSDEISKAVESQDKLRSACVDARRYLTKDMQLPQMHMNIVINNLGFAGAAASNYKQHIQLDVNNLYSVSTKDLTDLIVHECLHLYTFNKSKAFKQYIKTQVYPKAIWGEDYSPSSVFLQKLGIILKHGKIISENNTYKSSDIFRQIFEYRDTEDYNFWLAYFKQETKKLFSKCLKIVQKQHIDSTTKAIYLLRQALVSESQDMYVELTRALDNNTSGLELDYSLGDMFMYKKDLPQALHATSYTARSSDEYIPTLGDRNTIERKQATRYASKLLQGTIN